VHYEYLYIRSTSEDQQSESSWDKNSYCSKYM